MLSVSMFVLSAPLHKNSRAEGGILGLFVRTDQIIGLLLSPSIAQTFRK